MRRTAFTALFAALILVGLLPASAMHAQIPGPTLVSPVDATVSTVAVDLHWERVEGASRYRVRVWHGTTDYPVIIDEPTVNDRMIVNVAFAGDLASWSVAAIDQEGVEGPASVATFTTARIAPQPVSPADGATYTFPDRLPAPSWRSTPWLYESLLTGRDGAPLELSDRLAPFGPGTWRWQIDAGWPIAPPGPASVRSPVRSFSVAWPDAVPVLGAPADGATFAAGAAFRLSWDPVPGASLYQWRLGPAGEAPITSSPFLDTRLAMVDVGGFPAGTYVWQVRAAMAGTEYPKTEYGPWSATRSLTVASAGSVALTSPADGATLDEWPVLRWSAVPGAYDYRVQIGDSPDPLAQGTSYGDPATAFTFLPPQAGSPFSVTSAAATRYWRVTAQVGTGHEVPVSPWRSFSVRAAAPAIASEVPATLLGPADCSTTCPAMTGLPLLRWTPVPGAASYRVFFRWSGGPGAADAWVDVGSPSLVPHRAYQSSPGARTAWAVLACPAVGCSETMPAPRREYAITLPTPVLSGPPGDVVQAGPSSVLDWDPIQLSADPEVMPIAVGYDVESTVTLDGDVKSHAITSTGSVPTSMTREVLWTGSTLDWRVRATTTFLAGGTITGDWSPMRRVTRTEPAIALVGPASTGTVGSTPILDWDPLPYAVMGYDVEIARTSLLAMWGDGYRSWTASTGATSLELPELAPGEYRWRVRRTEGGYHQGEGLGPWSTGYFTVAGDPAVTLLSPAAGDSVRADGAILTWAPFPTVSEYTILIGTTPDFDGSTAIYRGYSPTTTHAVATALPTGQLFWKVCAATDCSPVSGLTSGESVVRAMTITPPPGPDVIAPVTHLTVVTPRVGAALTTGGGVASLVSWTATDSASSIGHQDLQYRRGTGSWIALPAAPSARTAVVTVLPGAAYSFRVRATDSAGNTSAWATLALSSILRQENSTMWRWSSGWTRATSSTASGGSVRWATKPGASGTIVVAARAIAVVAPKSTARGSATIWIDGVRVATVRFDTSPVGSRRIIFSKAWATVGTHTVIVKVVGTSGHPRIDLDALVTFR